VGKADRLLEGAEVELSEIKVSDDVDDEDDVSGSAEVAVDGVASLRPIETERDTLGSTLSRAVRPALMVAGRSSDVGATGSALLERRVSTLVTAPEASM
jgi:hypothetical protein